MEDDFIDAVLLPNESIGPDQAKAILANKDKWNPEEQERFKDLTEEGYQSEEYTPPAAPETPAATTPETQPTVPATPAAPATPDPAATTTEEKKDIISFNSKAELDEYIKKHTASLKEEGATAAEIKEKKEDIVEFWKYAKNEEGALFIPKENSPLDWNHAFNHFLNQLIQNPEIFINKVAPQFRDAIYAIDRTQNVELQKIQSEYDAELDGLFKAGKIPDPKTEEGRLVDKALSNFVIQYNLWERDNPFAEAYDLWSKIPVEHGGGLNYKPSAPAGPTKQQVSTARKQIASKSTPASGGGAESRNTKTRRPYAELHRSNIDAILDRHRQ